MAACLEILLFFLVCALDVSEAGIAENFQNRETRRYAEEGCGPNRYALFCRDAEYKLTVANPNTEYVSSVKMKRLYDFLSHSKCYEHLKSFLCGALFPMCTEDPFEITFPCRDVCETAETNCHPVLKQYGEAWPDELNCTRFYDVNCLGSEVVYEYNYDYDYNYNYDYETEEDPIPVTEAPPTEKTETSGRHSEERIHGQENRNHHSHHAHRETEERHDNTEQHRTKQRHTAKKVKQIVNRKSFWKLFKKTLVDVSRSLKSLSDTIETPT